MGVWPFVSSGTVGQIGEAPLPARSKRRHDENWRKTVKRIWTIIGVSNVARSVRWYQSLFGQPETPPGHDHFGQILGADGTVLLCPHEWGAHDHPYSDDAGHGVTRKSGRWRPTERLSQQATGVARV